MNHSVAHMFACKNIIEVPMFLNSLWCLLEWLQVYSIYNKTEGHADIFYLFQLDVDGV